MPRPHAGGHAHPVGPFSSSRTRLWVPAPPVLQLFLLPGCQSNSFSPPSQRWRTPGVPASPDAAARRRRRLIRPEGELCTRTLIIIIQTKLSADEGAALRRRRFCCPSPTLHRPTTRSKIAREAGCFNKTKHNQKHQSRFITTGSGPAPSSEAELIQDQLPNYPTSLLFLLRPRGKHVLPVVYS